MTTEHHETNGAKPEGWDAAKAESAKKDETRVEKSAPRVGRYDVPLAPIERLALGAKIAQLDADVEKLEADKKSAVSEWNGKIEAAGAQLRAACATLRKGAEEKDVRVIDIKDFGTNTYRVVDADDEKRVYFERALEARERQADLLAQSAIEKAAKNATKPAEPEPKKDEPAAETKPAEPEAPAAPAPDASSFDGGAEPPTTAPKKAKKSKGEEPSA